MNVFITDWALNSYLNLVHANTFTSQEYKQSIRPDVELLKVFPNDAKFGAAKFWSPAEHPQGRLIRDGFKMKWHNMGPGRIQLRLTVGLLGDAFLCEAYVKTSPSVERRALARFKVHLDLIRRGQHTVRGRLP